MSPAEKKVALKEVRVMNQFRSKFVVRCEGESFIEDDMLNLILEYCDAGDVKQYLAKQKRPLKVCPFIFPQAACSVLDVRP